MKKYILLFVFIQILTFVNGADNDNSDNSEIEIKITNTNNFGFFKNGRQLTNKADFTEALAPVPEALELYLVSRKWRTASFVLLGTTIGTQFTATTLSVLVAIFGDPVIFPQYYNYTTQLALTFTIVALGIISIPEIIMMIVSFVKTVRKRNEAVYLYNKKIKSSKNEKIGLKISGAPLVSVDNNLNCSLGASITIRF